MDFREIILRRLRQLGWSQYELIEKRLDGVETKSKCYASLQGSHDMLGAGVASMFKALGLSVAPVDTIKTGKATQRQNRKRGRTPTGERAA